jgi:hypothetical protein
MRPTPRWPGAPGHLKNYAAATHLRSAPPPRGPSRPAGARGVQAQLGDDLADVHLDGSDRKEQPRGDVPAGQPARRQRRGVAAVDGDPVPDAAGDGPHQPARRPQARPVPHPGRPPACHSHRSARRPTTCWSCSGPVHRAVRKLARRHSGRKPWAAAVSRRRGTCTDARCRQAGSIVVCCYALSDHVGMPADVGRRRRSICGRLAIIDAGRCSSVGGLWRRQCR